MNSIPPEVDPETDDAKEISPFEREVMDKIIAQALAAHENGTRCGIVAAIIRRGEIVAIGENEVNDHSDPTKHAEMVAFTKAAGMLKTTDLSGCTLISTLQPCEMCLSAMRFAGIDRAVFAARQANVAGKYFAFPDLHIEDFRAAGPDFSYTGGLREAAVLHLYVDGAE